MLPTPRDADEIAKLNETMIKTLKISTSLEEDASTAAAREGGCAEWGTRSWQMARCWFQSRSAASVISIVPERTSEQLQAEECWKTPWLGILKAERPEGPF